METSGAARQRASTSSRSRKHRPRDNVRYVTDWVSHKRHWFDNAFAIVIEQQMRVNMRIIAAVIETLFFNYSKVYVIPPRHVKVHYGLSTGQYATNKKAADHKDARAPPTPTTTRLGEGTDSTLVSTRRSIYVR